MSDDRQPAGDPGAAADGRAFDPERTVGGDADLLAEVRHAVEAARRGLSSPPPTGDPDAREHGATSSSVGAPGRQSTSAQETGSPPADVHVAPARAGSSGGDATRALPPPVIAGDPSTDTAVGPAGPTPGGGGPATLPPPTSTDTVATQAASAGAAPVATPPTVGRTTPATPQRWVPPARLKPAATPAPVSFLDEPAPKRNRTWWIVGAAAIVALAGVGVTLAVTGGDSTPGDDSSVSVPGSGGSAPITTVAVSTSVSPTNAASTTQPAATTAVPTTAVPTTVAPTTAAPVTEAPTTEPAPLPETVAPEPPVETVPAAPAGG